MNLLTSIEYPTGHGLDFYGFEVIGFYLKRFLLYYSDYAWNIRLLYGLIFACIVTMLILFVLFIRKIRQNRKDRREYESARKNLYNGFYQILISGDKPSVQDIETTCGMPLENIQLYKAETLSRLISEICMDLSRELGDIPNAAVLCSMTGVKALYEKNLATSKHVLLTLQNLANMHIPVTEGLLAVYINYYDANIRHMARICHVISSDAEPYQYFLEEFNEKQGLWRIMMLHRLFAWARANERQMPQFLVLAQKVKNEESVAFLIQEVAYWGSEKEKASLHEWFLSPNYRYRTAALHAVSILRDTKQEQAAIDSYEHQPEHIRQEVLRAVYAINSGKHTDFFVRAYRTSTSKLTREVALTCLYTYGNDGRRTFELLRDEYIRSNTDRTLMDQIDSLGVLNQMRML